MSVTSITPPHPNGEQSPWLAMGGERGTVILYYQGETNRCPSCGQTQWYVGRHVAQCVRCEAAIPLVTPTMPQLGDSLERPTLERKVA
jgi:hypothetical protein